MVRLMRRSKASPETVCPVICVERMIRILKQQLRKILTWARVNAGGEDIRRTFATTKTGLRIGVTINMLYKATERESSSLFEDRV
jgi:hypothetical protein